MMTVLGYLFIAMIVAYVAYIAVTTTRLQARQRRQYAESMDRSVRAVLAFLDLAPLQLGLTSEQRTRAAILRRDLEETLGEYLIPVPPEGLVTVVVP
jgi:hypothetical protein